MIVSSVPRKRYRNLILVLLLLLLATPVAAQQFEVNLEVSTTSGIGYNLLAGMAQGASDDYVPGEADSEEEPEEKPKPGSESIRKIGIF